MDPIDNSHHDGVDRQVFGFGGQAGAGALRDQHEVPLPRSHRVDRHKRAAGGDQTLSLLRFDAVYYDLFRCRRKYLADHPNLWAYTRDIYQWPGVAETVNMRHIRRHYYESLPSLNPSGEVPETGVPDFTEPAGRGRDVARLLTF